jgi:hypothetical protein
MHRFRLSAHLRVRLVGFMNQRSNRRRRQFVFGDVYSLENRVVPSSVGRLALTHPPAHINAASPVRRKVVHVGQAEAPSARVVANGSSGHPAATTLSPTVKRWSWLANTYWYVPTRNLPAVLFNSSTGTLAPVSDQTVFHITGYREGYFWGKTVTELGSSSASCSSMVGSVTPQGKVLLTFTQSSTSASPSITEGFGTMQRKFGQWTMENQMFTSPGETLQIGHWAYMVQTRPGLSSWNSLPLAAVSVPAFLNQCSGCGPTPITS